MQSLCVKQVPPNSILVNYYVHSKNSLMEAAKEIAIGQSIGNPNMRSVWETEEMVSRHACKIVTDNPEQLEKEKVGYIMIAFPLDNINLKTDGISQLMCQILGGQVDITNIERCRVEYILMPEPLFKPKFGIDGIRKFTGVYDKPLLGGIVKPKIGVSPQTLLEIVKEMVDGGVNFIKEDEILGDPAHCPLEERTSLIANYLHKHAPNVVYATCINGDMPYLLERAIRVYELGGNGVHVNIWCGLGAYKAVRELDLPLFIHFQKSGDQVITHNHNPFSISWVALCALISWCGIDFAHAGMLGGYMNQSQRVLMASIKTLHHYGVMPALSCGMHPGLVDYIQGQLGTNDWMANVGGAIHSHPKGTRAGAAAMRQAIDGIYLDEYYQAIQEWGKK